MSAHANLGKWTIGERLGRGGNGLVHLARSGSITGAIKLLAKPDRVARFRDEVEGMRRLSNVEGVLPVLDSHVPDRPTKSEPAWFVMPLATPLQDALGPEPELVTVIEAVREIASVLAVVHSRGFSHRDIKPDNLFKHGSTWSVGDFGLIEFEGKSHKTAIGERIGPMHFIVPEMLLGLPNTDGKAADVYSIAKTLWVLLTGTNYPVPGTYSASSQICQLRSYVVLEHTTTLDQLLEHCTAINPADRPKMDLFERELTSWLTLKNKASTVATERTSLSLDKEWSEVIEAGRAEDLARSTQAKRHADMQAGMGGLYTKIATLHEELRKLFESAHLRDIEGPNSGTTPPGVTAYFPAKSVPERRVALEYRVWFTTDWAQPDLNKVDALGLARLIVSQPTPPPPIELYRYSESFLLNGPGQENCLEKLRQDALASVGNWLETGRQKWIELG